MLKETVNRTLEKHTPLKKKYVRANQIPFINKTLSKEIMKRSRLRNKFLNTKSEIDRRAYKKQRNYVVSLMRKEKESFYSTLDTPVVTENKKFWKTVKAFFIRQSYSKVPNNRGPPRLLFLGKFFNYVFICLKSTVTHFYFPS